MVRTLSEVPAELAQPRSRQGSRRDLGTPIYGVGRKCAVSNLSLAERKYTECRLPYEPLQKAFN